MKRLSLTLLTTAISILLFGQANVYDYFPAPGQFVNEIPAYKPESSLTMAAEAQRQLDRESIVSLGGFGGYIIFKCDEPLLNIADEYDFAIFGNSFATGAEPGVVSVCRDDNGNGKPDDTWYELAGSEYARSTTGYTITYYRPKAEDDASNEAIEKYIQWKDNQGNSGWLPKNSIHNQSYYPMWVNDDSISFCGTLLPDNTHDKNGDGTAFDLPPYAWGYADNQPNSNTDGCSFKLEWAVDSLGNTVIPNEIDFIKVHTGINKVNPKIGDTSTEISGIKLFGNNTAIENTALQEWYIDANHILHLKNGVNEMCITDIYGRILDKIVNDNISEYPFSDYPHGIYIITTDKGYIKFIR